MKGRNLSYVVFGAIMALATPSRTSNTTYIPPPPIVAPLEQRVSETQVARKLDIEAEAVERIWKRYDRFIEKAANAHKNVRPAQVYAMIYLESRGKSRSVSPKDAVGLMQITPITQKHLGITRQEAFNPEISIMKGVGYYADLLERYDGNEVLALAAYNWGPRKVDSLLRWYGWNPKNVTYKDLKFRVNRETRNYVANVLEKEGIIGQMFL